jgi:type I restriction enzyme R subunit
MHLHNFIVRPRRRLVEQYARPEAWAVLHEADFDTLARDLAGLPSALVDEDEQARRFDLLMLRLQLALLRADPGFEAWRDQVRAIAALLEDKATIPMVREHMPLLQEMQSDVWWDDVTMGMLENARKRLRLLVKLIDRAKRQPVYTDFEDELGHASAVHLPGFGSGADFERFRAKARQFLRQHEHHLTIRKLRGNLPLTPADLGELERILVEAGVGTAADCSRARQESSGLGLFVRSLIGLDREAAKQAFGQFLSGKTPSAHQIEFINLIIDHLTEHGIMDPGRLYESPFTDINPRGPDGVFTSEQVDALVSLLHDIRQRAAA